MHQGLSKRNWKINYSALCHARYNILGLEYPVICNVIPNMRMFDGEYNPYPLHVVKLNGSQTASDASHTIWHELGHALQCERDYEGNGLEFEKANYDTYRDFYDDDGKPYCTPSDPGYSDWLDQYMSLPIEVEAEGIANRYARKYPLVLKS